MALAEHTDQPWIPKDSFANRLILIRRELNLSQDEAATLCGLSTPTWAAWERDGARQPRGQADVVDKIATATGVDRNWLMWGNKQIGCDYDATDYQQVLFPPDLAA